MVAAGFSDFKGQFYCPCTKENIFQMRAGTPPERLAFRSTSDLPTLMNIVTSACFISNGLAQTVWHYGSKDEPFLLIPSLQHNVAESQAAAQNLDVYLLHFTCVCVCAWCIRSKERESKHTAVVV